MVSQVLFPGQILDIKRKSAIATIAKIFAPIDAKINAEIVRVLFGIPDALIYDRRIGKNGGAYIDIRLPDSTCPNYSGI